MRRRLLLLLLLLSGCTPHSTPPPAPPAPPPVVFTDVTPAAGIHFQHINGATGKKYLPETMGSGCAFLDYDNDGRQDILLVNSTTWTQQHPAGATLRLYHNDDGQHFTDVTAQVGLSVAFYGMGVAIGDYDNDGWDDLYITGVGGSRLFHNESGKRNDQGRGKREEKHLNTLTPQHPGSSSPAVNSSLFPLP